MERVIASIAPRYGNRWRLLVVCAFLLSLLLAQPMVARADDDDNHKGRFTTTAVIFIADPGHVAPLGNNRFRTTGEIILGCISTSTWDLIPVVSGTCTPSNTNLSVNHSSITTVSPKGHIVGQGNGAFSVGAFLGKYEGPISAQLGGPGGISSIQDRGTWSAADTQGNHAKGTFNLAMQWNDNWGTLVGTLTLNGVHNRHDDRGDD